MDGLGLDVFFSWTVGRLQSNNVRNRWPVPDYHLMNDSRWKRITFNAVHLGRGCELCTQQKLTTAATLTAMYAALLRLSSRAAGVSDL